MIQAVLVVALALSVANWLLFVAATVVGNLPKIRAALRGTDKATGEHGVGGLEPRSKLPEVITATGTLATSLRSAGPASTAAALSLACLVIAAVAAGLDKI